MDIRIPISSQSNRFLDRLRNFIRLRGLAYKTEQTYVFWIKRFIRFHGRRHPETMGTAEVEAFLSHLVLQTNVSVRTQRKLLGHSDVRTTEIYTHVVRKGGFGVRSPVDEAF